MNTTSSDLFGSPESDADFDDALMKREEERERTARAIIAEEPSPATEKQVNFIHDLLDKRDLSSSQYSVPDLKEQTGALTKEEASRWITRLLELPKLAKQTQPGDRPEPKAGMYRSGDEIFRVYLGQRSGRMLVKKLVQDDEYDSGWTYTYVGAAAYKLPADAEALPIEEAKKFGRMTGTCCVCARRLDVPESVEAGIGPVCAGRMDRNEF